MKKSRLDELRAANQYPCVSLILPVHRHAPENAQDQVRVKNMISEATKQLDQKMSHHDAAPIVERLTELVDSIDFEHVLDGIALFVNAELAFRVDLPFSPKERVLVSDHFVIRDVVRMVNRAARYYVVVLSEKKTRLLLGTTNHLVEHRGPRRMRDAQKDFPMVDTGKGGESRAHDGEVIKMAQRRDEYHRQFFRMVDHALGDHLKEEDLPVVVIGIGRYQAFFNEVGRHNDHIIGTVSGTHDHTHLPELTNLVWPIVQKNMQEQRKLMLAKLADAVGKHKFAAGLSDVWSKAEEGAVYTLLVEEGYIEKAIIEEGGTHPLVSGPSMRDHKDCPGARVDDAVEELVELVLNKGGKVTFVESGALSGHDRVAAILRYEK
jgi:peptide subunit release factor 1 (eRF1)